MASLTADEHVAAAEREVEAARRRLAETHEQVVKPLRQAAVDNNFAALIAASLRQGRDRGKGKPA